MGIFLRAFTRILIKETKKLLVLHSQSILKRHEETFGPSAFARFFIKETEKLLLSMKHETKKFLGLGLKPGFL